jgi:hypothetical protein
LIECEDAQVVSVLVVTVDARPEVQIGDRHDQLIKYVIRIGELEDKPSEPSSVFERDKLRLECQAELKISLKSLVLLWSKSIFVTSRTIKG